MVYVGKFVDVLGERHNVLLMSGCSCGRVIVHVLESYGC